MRHRGCNGISGRVFEHREQLWTYFTSRDDPAIVLIVEGLALPLSPAQIPPRPQLPPVSARPVRPTAQQMFRSKASGAAAAARRGAALLEARAEDNNNTTMSECIHVAVVGHHLMPV